MDELIILNRIRVDIGNVSGSISELMQYAGMSGFNDNYEPQVKPRLVGTWTINDWYTSAQLAQAQAAFDGLTIVGDPNYLINFNDFAVQTLDSNQPNYNPAVAIILQGKSLGITLPGPVVSGQTGRWMLTKSQASTITNIGNWFKYKTAVIDTNGIVSSDTTATYTISRFEEFIYFTGITLLNANNGFFGERFTYIEFPSTIIGLGNQAVASWGGPALTMKFNSVNPPSFDMSEVSPFYQTTITKIYVGDGSSAAHDDAILADYVAASGWSSYASIIDTWYNYLHPTT